MAGKELAVVEPLFHTIPSPLAGGGKGEGVKEILAPSPDSSPVKGEEVNNGNRDATNLSL